MGKTVIYQVFTRLFGNDNPHPVKGGTIEQNGSGKLTDFTPKALAQIRRMGATHVWYTGVIAHASQTDYTAFGLPLNHPAVVKGKAGSPYAIRDYYDIDPDLAVNVPDRMKEFEKLVARTHKAGMGVIIDFVPNHVARQYHSVVAPAGVRDLGQDDDTDKAFLPNNNFYYVPGKAFAPSFATDGYSELPAKATGNDHFSPHPGMNDWYETVKLNYGVDYMGGKACHFNPVPDTWHKMLHILLYWADKQIDGFRCDMAEMVPVAFWQWAIPQVRAQHPGIVFIAEVYNPAEYRHYIFDGKFDYLYDKVGLYDTLRAVSNGWISAQNITFSWQQVEGIRDHMLNFLENHDEQRIASDFFGGDARKGKAALLVSTLLYRNPMMVYFGQELGERGMDEEGFSGRDGRTTIFDYWTVDSIRRWRDGGNFSGSRLTADEASLRAYYTCVLNLCHTHEVVSQGDSFDLMYVNPHLQHQYAFVRRAQNECMLVVANFVDAEAEVPVCIPAHLFSLYRMKGQEQTEWTDLLTGRKLVTSWQPDGTLMLDVPAYGGLVLCRSLAPSDYVQDAEKK